MDQHRRHCKQVYRTKERVKEDGERILAAVLTSQQMTRERFFSKRRYNDQAYARHLFCYIAYHYFGFSNNDIAYFIDKNHATVCYGRGKIADMISITKHLDAEVYIIAYTGGYRDRENRIEFLTSEILLMQTELNQLQNQAT